MLDIQQSTILIVDDIPTNIRVLEEFLEASGIRIAIAKNGESAIAKALRILPDLILLDVMMPGMNGFETCRRLKADPATCDIPIIFLTALTDNIDKVKGLQLGAVDYITKPIHNEEVLARIKVHLSLRHAQARLMNEVAERRQAELKLQDALDELKRAQVQLVQTEKMSSLGRMLAGVAHEINNPMNFIFGNLDYAKDYVYRLLKVLGLYQKHYPAPAEEIQKAIDSADLPFVVEDITKLLESMAVGVDRIQEIVMSLQTFSRMGGNGAKLADLHAGIDSTIMILQHRLKSTPKRWQDIQIVRNYGDLPLIECHANQLNQVFMNILSNAIDALDAHLEQQSNNEGLPVDAGTITISTGVDATGWAVVQISDDGPGIPDAIKDKMFDPFFTTKPVGKGTGLGLSISYQIIVNQHHGVIEYLSNGAAGTTFIIKIPAKQASVVRPAKVEQL